MEERLGSGPSITQFGRWDQLSTLANHSQAQVNPVQSAVTATLFYGNSLPTCWTLKHHQGLGFSISRLQASEATSWQRFEILDPC